MDGGEREKEREKERVVRGCSARVVHSAVLQVYLGEILSRENRATLYPESPNGINKINDASLFDLSSPPR